MIRQEENKTKAQYRRLKGIQGREEAYDTQVATFWGLRHHRTGPVRSEARAAQLAYAYVRGKSFKFVENTTWIGWWSEKDNKAFLVPDMEYYVGRVARLAVKYGPVGTTDDEDVMKENIRSWMLADWTKERDTYFRDRQAKALQKIAARTKAREARKAA
jgi:hypothetical protein